LRRAVVCALLLGALACGRAERDRARDEAALRTQLASMRNAIAAYTKSHGQGPAALRDAMPAVPIDPLTHSATTWRLTTEETVKVNDFTAGSTTAKRVAIIEVHSGAVGRDGSGRRYSEY
jgi:type II secretory pathway pseudopilin PulG